MNKNMKMFIICAVFALLSSCGKFTSSLSEQDSLSEQGGLSEQVSSDTIKFSEFTVKIKYKKDNGGDWSDLGTLVVRKEEDGIETGLNVIGTIDGQVIGYTSSFLYIEESEVNNFVKAMTKGGSFKTSLYYGYKTEQNNVNGIKNKEIKTKIETINGSEYITFAGDKIKDSGDKIAEYAISLEELKKNLK
ncbi:borrelia outer surface E family protein (plasmid) [Borreliella afzelii PKo]|uniref:Borrelia outer surface E family protein n=2 Tax=Borreliella afzelii TaxID=29518 RepID=G0ISR1_BORAP|nr:borrelia outer surface E family protein [Borreliella afzelii PKo]